MEEIIWAYSQCRVKIDVNIKDLESCSWMWVVEGIVAVAEARLKPIGKSIYKSRLLRVQRQLSGPAANTNTPQRLIASDHRTLR